MTKQEQLFNKINVVEKECIEDIQKFTSKLKYIIQNEFSRIPEDGFITNEDLYEALKDLCSSKMRCRASELSYAFLELDTIYWEVNNMVFSVLEKNTNKSRKDIWDEIQKELDE